jgi:hypothetical protein
LPANFAFQTFALFAYSILRALLFLTLKDVFS